MEHVNKEVIRANNALVALLIVFSHIPGVRAFLLMHLGTTIIDNLFGVESAFMRCIVIVYSLVVSSMAFVAFLNGSIDLAIDLGAYWLVVTFMSWAYMAMQDIKKSIEENPVMHCV